MATLLRFYGFQRIAASLLGGLLMWLAVKVLGSTPPEFWEEWPPKASLALSNLVAGSLGLAFCGWVYLILKPVLSLENIIGLISRIAFRLTMFSGIGGLWQCLVGCSYLARGEEGCALPVLLEWMRVVGWPLLVGLLPVGFLEAYHWANENPHLRRWLFSGKGHAATWIRPGELSRVAKPLGGVPNTNEGFTEEY
jgi:hypothetical protein